MVPGPMVTLVMITKSLGSAISVEQFVLLAPAAGKREAFAREVEGRSVGRKASNAVPANAWLGLLLFSRWWVGLGSKAALRPSVHTLEAFGNEVGRGTAVALAEALAPQCHVCT